MDGPFSTGPNPSSLNMWPLSSGVYGQKKRFISFKYVAIWLLSHLIIVRV